MRCAEKKLGIQNPDFDHVNALLAQVISACTTSLRFESELNASLDEIQTNLIPSKQFRYPILSLSPVSPAGKGHFESWQTKEIIADLFEAKNVLADCERLSLNRYLSAVVLLRGQEAVAMEGDSGADARAPSGTQRLAETLRPDQQLAPIQVASVSSALQELMKPKGSRVIVKFAPWIGAGGAFKVGVVGVPPCLPPGPAFMAPANRQGAMIGNTTAVRQLFVRQYKKFLKLFFHKAYTWQYIASGGDEDSFNDAREGVKQIITAYEKLLTECCEQEKQGAQVDGRTGWALDETTGS